MLIEFLSAELAFMKAFTASIGKFQIYLLLKREQSRGLSSAAWKWRFPMQRGRMLSMNNCTTLLKVTVLSEFQDGPWQHRGRADEICARPFLFQMICNECLFRSYISRSAADLAAAYRMCLTKDRQLPQMAMILLTYTILGNNMQAVVTVWMVLPL